MEASLVKDRENPYRYGVLQGNHVEDRFSLDLVNRQKRQLLPASTMKDDYRWYNTVLFDKKDEYLKRHPELTPQIYNNKGLKPFLYKPQHIINQEEYRTKQQPGQDGQNLPGTTGPTGIMPTLNVCCPQEDNRDRHHMPNGHLDDPQPHDTMGDMEMDISNAPKNEKNNFSQYGGWVLQSYQGRHTMYTKDREGIVNNILPEGQKPDSQAASCTQHILFGHGPQVQDFRTKEFRTIHNLGMDNKIKSKVFLDSHFAPEVYMSQTQSAFNKTGGRSASNAPTATGSQAAANGWYTPKIAPAAGAAAGASLGPKTTNGGFVNSIALGGREAISNSQTNGYHTADYSRNLDPHLKRYGEVDTLKEARRTGDFKYYDDFTKRFDQSQVKTGLRDPY